MSSVKRTYSRQHRTIPSSPVSTLSSSPPKPTRKRPLDENTAPQAKRVKVSKEKQKTLTQLHFCIDQTILRTCSLCDLSYIKGAPGDESLHRTHCNRVQRGMEWGKEEEKECEKAGLSVVATNVALKDGRTGRIIRVKADAGGKIGAKLTTLLQTINLTLSSPPLPPTVLKASKIYLFLLPPAKSSGREKIVGCVVAQHITTAMAIATPAECEKACQSDDPDTQPSPSPTRSLVAVDTSTGVFCHPEPLPTPLGIPRLFVPSSHRRLGIATKLLSAAAETFIYGCKLDPTKGQVAFTQPTGSGNAIMKNL